MIPKKIHLCWFGPAAKNEIILKCEDSVRTVLPDYEIVYWMDENCPKLPFVEECYRWKKWALLADYIRLYALYHFGGIYLDTDVEVLKSFDDLLHDDLCKIGFEQAFLARGCIGNAVLIAPPRHSFVAACYRMFLCSLYAKVKPFYGVKIGHIATFQRGLWQYVPQVLGDIEILPKTAFYPGEGEVNADTYAVHHLEGSWHRRRGLVHDWQSLQYRTARLMGVMKRRFQHPEIMAAARLGVLPKWNNKVFKKQVGVNRMLEDLGLARPDAAG